MAEQQEMPRRRQPAERLEITHSFNPAVMELLKSIATGLGTNSKILTKLTALEKHMSLQDDKIAAFKASTDTKLAALGTSLDTIASAQTNIAADEAALLAKLNTLDDLSPASQAVLNEVTTGLTAIVTRSESAASSLKSLADSLPDEPAPTEPTT